jgi:hypothetical protein
MELVSPPPQQARRALYSRACFFVFEDCPMADANLDHQLNLLAHLRSILVALGEAEQVPEESHALFMERFDELLTLLPQDPIESQYLGQDILCQVIQRYPQIAHLVPRDLLWFFAGDCLHFMPDEEIELYQSLEERRYEAELNDEPFDWNMEKQLLAMPAQANKH